MLRVSGLRYDDPRALQSVPRRHAADPGAGHLQAAELRKHPHQVQRVPPQGQFEHTGSLLVKGKQLSSLVCNNWSCLLIICLFLTAFHMYVYIICICHTRT